MKVSVQIFNLHAVGKRMNKTAFWMSNETMKCNVWDHLWNIKNRDLAKKSAIHYINKNIPFNTNKKDEKAFAHGWISNKVAIDDKKTMPIEQ